MFAASEPRSLQYALYVTLVLIQIHDHLALGPRGSRLPCHALVTLAPPSLSSPSPSLRSLGATSRGG